MSPENTKLLTDIDGATLTDEETEEFTRQVQCDLLNASPVKRSLNVADVLGRLRSGAWQAQRLPQGAYRLARPERPDKPHSSETNEEIAVTHRLNTGKLGPDRQPYYAFIGRAIAPTLIEEGGEGKEIFPLIYPLAGGLQVVLATNDEA